MQEETQTDSEATEQEALPDTDMDTADTVGSEAEPHIAEPEEIDEELEHKAAQLSEEERESRIAFLKPVIEGAVMAAGEPLSLVRLQSLFDDNEKPSKGMLVEVLTSIQGDFEGRGFELAEVASGWRFQVRPDYAVWINRLWEEKPQKYSRALLETLALIAYRQPLTRGDIEEVRGVAVSSHIMKTLVERDWVKIVGHRDVPGRPSLYATTRDFLDYFNLKSLDELPTLGELRDIDSLNASLDLGSAENDDTDNVQAEEKSVESEVVEVEAEAEAEPNLEQESEIQATTETEPQEPGFNEEFQQKNEYKGSLFGADTEDSGPEVEGSNQDA